MPVATATPIRSGSAATSTPESCSAWRAAATIICAKRSMRRACLCSMNSVGSNPFASQAKCVWYAVASNRVISPAADSPASRPAQVVWTSLPSGVTAPRPVTTTLLLPFMLMSHPQAAVDEEHFARDERGLVRAEEAYRPGHVLRRAETAEGRVLKHQVLQFLGELLGEPRRDIAGGDDVGADAAIAELPRERLREADDPRLRRRVVGLPGIAVDAHDARDVD